MGRSTVDQTNTSESLSPSAVSESIRRIGHALSDVATEIPARVLLGDAIHVGIGVLSINAYDLCTVKAFDQYRFQECKAKNVPAPSKRFTSMPLSSKYLWNDPLRKGEKNSLASGMT